MKETVRAVSKGVEILIAEDSPTQSELLKHLLTEHGYSVTIAANGKQALAAALQGKPAVIITDVVMPEMDGYTLCKEIKSQVKLKDTPVILLTSLSSPQDVIKGLECGADNFVRKPFNEEYLLSRINQVLTNQELRKTNRIRIGVEISFGGQRHFITSERQQILDLLISTYDDGSRLNEELQARQKELAQLAEQLERKVEERTATLTAEIAERKQTEDKLRQSEEQFRLISENVADLIAVLDLQGRRVYNSPSYKKILDDPEAVSGTVSFDEIHPEDREKIMRIFEETVRTGLGQRTDYRFLLKDGSIRYVESQGSVIRDAEGKPEKVIVVSRDVTERRKLEDQLSHSQKMEAVGQLAGGVAHDFNNLLTVINGYSEIMLQQLKPDDPNQKHVAEIKKAGDRAAALTHQLLAFSRQQVLAPQVLDLNQVTANVHTMLKRLIGEDIDLVTIPGQSLGRVKADQGQIEQTLLNLAVNARDAMPRGGKLTIETANVDLDEAYARNHVDVKPGPHVRLTVSDTGTGMDAETQKRIFEPFFTTKEKGKGTGLGLSTVFGIIKQSEGHIWVYSEPGHGTTFKVYLPRVDKPPEVVGPAKAEPEQPRGTETILLVEDEPSVRLLVRTTLESKGYHVLESTNGAEALLVSQQHKGNFHLLLTDLVMPGISGRVLAEQMVTLQPELKVLFMSGYTDDAVVRHGGLEAGMAFIQKPFTPDALARKVREVLDASRGSK
jgi:PAS domain S-box-containing protein